MTALPTRREATPSEMQPAPRLDIPTKVRHLDGMIDELCDSRLKHSEKLNQLADQVADLRADVTHVDQGLGLLRIRTLTIERQYPADIVAAVADLTVRLAALTADVHGLTYAFNASQAGTAGP